MVLSWKTYNYNHNNPPRNIIVILLVDKIKLYFCITLLPMFYNIDFGIGDKTTKCTILTVCVYENPSTYMVSVLKSNFEN